MDRPPGGARLGPLTFGRPATAAALTVAAGWATLDRLGRTWGSTADERRADLPGDDLVPRPHLVADHAVTVATPAADMWPWLVQMGWGRAGWYTAAWVDRLLFPANRPSAITVHHELQELAVGDWVPDGPADTRCGFVVEELEPHRHLVLRSSSHLPLSWRERGAWVEWSWSFVLAGLDPGRTRVHFRWRAVVGPTPLRLALRLALPPADLLMSRDMLRGLAARAEGRTSPAGPGPRAAGQKVV